MKTIIVRNTNLYAIAATLLGDATQWVGIARANNLEDPFIEDLRELKLPEVNHSAGGDIAAS
jgi:hypothetical protein